MQPIDAKMGAKGQNQGSGSFHSHSLGVTGFLGGITFAALILLIQSRKDIVDQTGYPNLYFDGLITGTAVSSVFFIVATIGLIRVASGEKDDEDTFTKIMSTFASLGFFGLMALLPFIVWPFLPVGAVIVAIVEVITIGLYVRFVMVRKVRL